jgi:hypothetical protein
MSAAVWDIREQWEAVGENLSEDLMLDATPIFALGGI